MTITQPEHLERVSQELKAHDVDTVILGVPDAHGVLRARRLPAWRFAADPAAPVTFCEHLFTMDAEAEPISRPAGYDGWWPSWEDGGRGDFHGHPDLSTFRVLPWLPRTALVLCDCALRDGSAVTITSRQMLRDVCDRLAERGLTAKVAAEYEFYLLRDNAPGSAGELEPLSRDHTYWSAMRAGLDDALVGTLRRHLEQADIVVDSWVAESGPGQYEMTLLPTDPLEAADRAFLFRHAVKEIAAQDGLIASFMARPFPDKGGSGMHLNCSLWSGGENAFFEPAAERRLSPLALHYIAGVVGGLRELCPVYAPTPNAYKRYRPDLAAGSQIAWAVENKSVAVRAVNTSEGSCRVELRAASADADPYLVAAATLASGLLGIERELEPPPECFGNAYTAEGVESLPQSLTEALAAFEGGTVARDALGDEFVAYAAGMRRWELDRMGRAVTDFEIGRYLR